MEEALISHRVINDVLHINVYSRAIIAWCREQICLQTRIRFKKVLTFNPKTYIFIRHTCINIGR